jgi:hypothetical protein
MNLYYNYLQYLLYIKIPEDISTVENYLPAHIFYMQGVKELDEEHYYHEGQFQFGVPINYEE